MRLKWGLISIVSLLGGVGCGHQSHSNPVRFRDAERDAIEKVRQDLGSPAVAAIGAIVDVTWPGRSWSRAFGMADARRIPMTTDMPFRIASITKTFTAAAVLKLVDDGKLKVTDLVGKYLANPDPIRFPDWDSITILQLANHTSGLAEITDSPEFKRLNQANPARSWKPNELLKYSRENQPPGAAYGYANTNYVVLGLLIEAVSHQPLPIFVARRLLMPLALTDTRFAKSGRDPFLACRGFSGQTDVTIHDPSWAWAAGNMISTAADLARWMKTLCSGKMLSRQSTALLLKVEKPSLTVGFGVEQYSGWLGHTGRIEGYSSACFYNSKLDATVVVMVNRMDPTDPNADRRKNMSRELPILRDVIHAFFPVSPMGL